MYITTSTLGSFTRCHRDKSKETVSVLSTRLVTNYYLSLTAIDWRQLTIIEFRIESSLVQNARVCNTQDSVLASSNAAHRDLSLLAVTEVERQKPRLTLRLPN